MFIGKPSLHIEMTFMYVSGGGGVHENFNHKNR